MAAHTSSQHNNFSGSFQSGGGTILAGITVGRDLYVNSMSSDISNQDRSIQYLCLYWLAPSNTGAGGIPPDPQTSPPVPVSAPLLPTPSKVFTGRETILKGMSTFFATENDGRGRKEYLLYGMGGAGKTQIALKFVDENRER